MVVKVKILIRPMNELADLEIDANAFLLTIPDVKFVDAKFDIHNDGNKLMLSTMIIFKA